MIKYIVAFLVLCINSSFFYSQQMFKQNGIKDILVKNHYNLSYFEDSLNYNFITYLDSNIKKELIFERTTLNSPLSLSNIDIPALKINNSKITGMFILDNVAFKNISLLNYDSLNVFIISNVSKSKIILNKCFIDTLYILQDPKNVDPTRIEFNDCRIEYLEILSNGYFDRIPEVRFNSVEFYKINVLSSIVNSRSLDFSLSRFKPDIIITNHNNYDDEQNLNNRINVLYNISQQYKQKGDLQKYIYFKARWKEQENYQNNFLTLIFNKILFEYLGGFYFSDIIRLGIVVISVTCMFTIIYIIIGFFIPIGEVYSIYPDGKIIRINKPDYILFYSYRNNSKNRLLRYLKDCILFSINHIITIRSDKTFNLTNYFWKEPRLFVAKGNIKIITFVQFLFGLWFTYILIAFIYNYIQI